MNQTLEILRAQVRPQPLVRRAWVHRCDPNPMAVLRDSLGPGPFAQIFLLVTDETGFEDVVCAARAQFGTDLITACTTAGEIAPQGYCDGGILAIGLPASHFVVQSLLVPDLGGIDQQALVDDFIHARQGLAAQRPNWSFEFAMTLIDGMSMREETLLEALAPGLGGMPLFGGSAGEGRKFGTTKVAQGDLSGSNAAVVTLVRTRCPVKVFSLDHFIPTERRMVVTRADPERRIVYEINAEPAAHEYARALGQSPALLCDENFAAHPLVVRIGKSHHVRAIIQRHDDGGLEFASAIDEGVVLILAIASDIEDHLRRTLADLSRSVRPDVILACDCLWRRIEIDDRQATREISRILSDHSVVGFNTYGEQIDAMHVNHTMTGVAIYPPIE